MGINTDISKKAFVQRVRGVSKIMTTRGLRAYFEDNEVAAAAGE